MKKVDCAMTLIDADASIFGSTRDVVERMIESGFENKKITGIKYVVVKLDNSGRGTKTVERFEFDDVIDAVEKHRKVRGDYSDSTYWDLVIDYA